MKKNIIIIFLCLFLLLPLKVGAAFPDQIINTGDLTEPYFIVTKNIGAFVYFQNIGIDKSKINAIEMNAFLVRANSISSTTEFVIHPIINKMIDKDGVKIIADTKVGSYIIFRLPLEIFEKNDNNISDIGFVFYPVDNGEYTFHGGVAWSGYNSEGKLLHLTLTYENNPIDSLISGYIKTEIKRSDEFEKAIERYNNKNDPLENNQVDYGNIFKIIISITFVVGGGYTIVKKMKIKNIFKYKTKDKIAINSKGVVYQADNMVVHNGKQSKKHLIKIEVKKIEKHISKNSPDDSVVFVEPYPFGYYLKVEFINQGDTNTIRKVELTINDKIVGVPVGFKAIKFEEADTKEETYHFYEKEDDLLDKGEYILNIVDAYDNIYFAEGSFPK